MCLFLRMSGMNAWGETDVGGGFRPLALAAGPTNW